MPSKLQTLSVLFLLTWILSGCGESTAPTPLLNTTSGPSSVVGHFLFYGNSAFLGDAAIAPDKSPLFSGQKASFANVSSYAKGLNGVIIDIQNLPSGSVVSASDFDFLVSPSSVTLPSLVAPALASISQVDIGGGTTRVKLAWADGAIKQRWLKVTVKAGVTTGFTSDDVSYFGSLVGEVGIGNSANFLNQNATDQSAIGINTTSSADITNIYDINRDGVVDNDLLNPNSDRSTAQSNAGPLSLITAP